MHQEVTTYYLNMTHPEQLKEKVAPRPNLSVQHSSVPMGILNQFFYLNVGQNYGWTDSANWTAEQWQSYAEQDNISLYIGYEQGTPFGYFELIDHNESIEIICFGLLPQFVGKGLGGYLLSEALKTAWSKTSERVWLHTCSLDHPNALANYQARGLSIYKEEKDMKIIGEAL